MYRNYRLLYDSAPIPTRAADPLLTDEDRRALEARSIRACAEPRGDDPHEPWIVFTSASVVMMRLLKLAFIAAVALASAMNRRLTQPRPGTDYWDQWSRSHSEQS